MAMSNAERQATCRDERDALDAPAEAGGAGASLKEQFREMVADYVERLIEKGLDNSGFSSEATLRATADKVVAEIGEDYLKDSMDRLVEQVMRVARHDFPLTDDHIDDAHVSIGCWPTGNRKEWYRQRGHRENG
jgi:hypothetical protein